MPAVPVQDLIGAHDLVKLDVEGFEAALLEAALAEWTVQAPLLLVEVHESNVALRQLIPVLLDAVDGRIYAARRATLVPVELDDVGRGRLATAYGTWDYLLVPARRAAIIEGLVER